MKLGLRADLPGVCGHTALGRWRGECSPGCRVPLLSRWLDGALDSLLRLRQDRNRRLGFVGTGRLLHHPNPMLAGWFGDNKWLPVLCAIQTL